MAQVNDFSPEQDFFKINPQYLVIEEFKQVKEKYKKEYSNILWFIVLMYDPDSKFNNLSYSSKLQKLQTMLPNEFLTKEDNLHKTLKSLYLELCETHPMRMLRVWKEKMDEKLQFMSENKYTVDEYVEIETNSGTRQKLVKGTWEMLEALQAGNVKAWKDYELIAKELAKDKENKAIGGVETSMSDRGGLLG